MDKEVFQKEIAKLFEEKKWVELRSRLLEIPIADIADILREAEKKDRAIVFRTLPRDVAADVFAELSPEDENILLAELTDEETRRLLADIDPDDRTELFEELPGRVTQRLLNLLTPEDLKEARSLLGYPEESVGRIMTPHYVAVRPHWTVSKALEHIRAWGEKSETINTVYVTDERWHLVGVAGLRDIILAESSQTIDAIMNTSVIAMSALDDQEEAVRTARRYDLTALPVVAPENILVGIVTVDDIMDVAEEETTEDFQRAAAVESFKIDLGQASARLLYSKRIGWLSLLVAINLIAGGIIMYYESMIAKAVMLVSFLPLIIDSAGNAGSQSATLTVRALATGEVAMHDWLRLLGKEAGVATLLGATMGMLVWAIGIFRAGPEVGLVVALTMLLVVIVGSLVGITLPFILSMLKLDPATASAPLITSIADIAGILIYFFIASRLLQLA